MGSAILEERCLLMTSANNAWRVVDRILSKLRGAPLALLLHKANCTARDWDPERNSGAQKATLKMRIQGVAR